MEYTVKMSARKTLGIYVLKDGSVEIRCPFGTSAERIRRFADEKQSWIDEMSNRNKERFNKKNEFTVNLGDRLPFLGKEYPVEGVSENKYGFDGNRFYVPAGIDSEQIKSCIISTYKKLAENIIKKRVDDIVPVMHTVPSAVKINSANTRWGSCSGKNSINFSWKLIMADKSAVDYVIVHELAHITEHNHSPAFWAIVERVIPDYRKKRELLRILGEKLQNENWD